jgi:hypothetical protein
MTGVLDFVVVTVYKFLMILDPSRSAANAQMVAIRACAIIMLFIILFLFGTCYMYLISESLIKLQTGPAFLFFMGLFVAIYIWITKKYSTLLQPKIESYDRRFSFKTWQIVVVAISLWVGPLSLVWGGLLFDQFCMRID